MKYSYITTTLPYVNNKPHIGFAMEIIRADTMARYKQLQGYEVFLNTGTDEHGQKLFDDASLAGKPVQEYVDYYSGLVKELIAKLGVIDDIHFIRTTDEHHKLAAQELWRRVRDNGYIYKARYQAKYCVGCELEKTDSELVDGKCEIHPHQEIQLLDEENYFFKFSALQSQLLELYSEKIDFVIPEFRFNEIKSFVTAGLNDFSVSRLKSKMSWGVPVPDDEDHVMYVWFDALTNYISTLGWPENSEQFEHFWVQGQPIQYCGQDNLRQQSAMWQAMLIAAGLPTTHQIHINGFILGSDGRKMSKSAGNGVDPVPLIDHYGTDALRYYLLHYVHPYDGSPVGYDSFHERYTADLVNGIGNLASRLLTMSSKYVESGVPVVDAPMPQEWIDAFEAYRMDSACSVILRHIADLDQAITKTEPFKLVKTDPEQASSLLEEYIQQLHTIARMFEPIIPETSRKIIDAIRQNAKPEEPLFPRLEKHKIE